MTTMMMMNPSSFNERPLAMSHGEASSPVHSRSTFRFAAHNSTTPVTNSSSSCNVFRSKPIKQPASQTILSDIERMALRKFESRPGPSKRNRDAATCIQRIVRGFLQRPKFRILYLQHRIDTIEQRKQADLDEIRRDLNDRKLQLKQRLTKRYQVERQRERQVNATYLKAKQTIRYLRHENETLRVKNEKLAEACMHLKHQNERIASAQTNCNELFDELTERLAEMRRTNEHLHRIIPDYKHAVELLQTELETRDEYCQVEHSAKMKYVDTIINMVRSLEQARSSGKLSPDLLNVSVKADEFLTTTQQQDEMQSFAELAGHESFRNMGRSQLIKGLGESLAALHYESDEEDNEIDEFASQKYYQVHRICTFTSIMTYTTPPVSPETLKKPNLTASPQTKETMIIGSNSASVRSNDWVGGYDPDFLRAYHRQLERGEPINIQGYNVETQMFRRGATKFRD
ncbi:hypothetical protein MPSEU_000052700 [Mayamaea pseudoterrestris]|nr:hypothetical protein MPSEU_000052700 [Mayamaea pseudoterrestris]